MLRSGLFGHLGSVNGDKGTGLTIASRYLLCRIASFPGMVNACGGALRVI